MKLAPVVAGRFYPGNPGELEAFFRSFEEVPLPDLPGEPLGLLLPHAGYVYSGALAALGYRALRGFSGTLVVAGPSHFTAFPGASLFAGEAVGTPLGDLPVDQEACRVLEEACPLVSQFAPAFAREHSVEVHFPLIRRYCPGASVVPLVTGQGRGLAEALVGALGELARRKPFLLVASSDLSHYPDHSTAVESDRRFLEAVLTGRAAEVRAVDRAILDERHPGQVCTHCGPEPLAALLGWAERQKAGRARLLGYRNSGDVTGEKERVVGYAAATFCR